MMKRSMSIGFSTLMVLSAILIIDMIPVSANDPVWNVDHYETAGDWIIDGTTTIFTYTTTTIIVNGNLTIMSGRTLTLQNVNLMMNATYDGQYNITVRSGGSLIIEDLDDDHTTTADVSVVTSEPLGGIFKYGFVVDGPNGYLELKNSEVHECGWDNIDPDWEDAGLNIQGPNAIVTGNDLSDNFRGLILHGSNAQGATIENNTIYDSLGNGLWISGGSIDNHIANNEIYNNEFGIFINSSVNSQTNYIISNTIRNNIVGGIYMEDSSKFYFGTNDIYQNTNYGVYTYSSSELSIITNNIYRNTNTGIYSVLSSDINIITNDIYENFARGIYISSGANFIIDTNNILNHTGDSGAHVTNSQDVQVLNNYFDGNGGSGSIDTYCSFYSQGSSGVIFADNTVVNSNTFGLRAQNQPDIVADNNHFENNVGGGAIMIFWDISDYGTANNNMILNSGWTGILTAGTNNFNVTNNTIDSIVAEEARGIHSVPGTFVNDLKVYIYNNDISNIGSNIEGSGIMLSSGTGHIVDSNTIDSIVSYGIAFDASDSVIKNNIVTNIGSTFAANSFKDVSGIAITGSGNRLINNTVGDCQAITGTYLVAGLQFGHKDSVTYARNTVIEDSYFYGNEINIRSEDSNGPVSNIEIINTTLEADGDTDWNIYLVYDAHITLLNTTFDNSSNYVSVDATSNLTVKWYLNVNVKDGGAGYDGAEVYVQNILGDDEPAAQPMITQTIDTEAGWVKWIQLTEFIQEGSTRTHYSSHWVNISAGPKGGLARPEMSTSRSIVIDLNDIPEIINLKRGRNSIYRADTVYLFVNSTDGEDPENLLQPIFEYREPNDYGWNTSYFGSAVWEGAGFWKVPFTPPIEAPYGFYDIRVRVLDTYGSYSPWVTYLNATGVDVKNNLPYVEGMSNQSFSPTAPLGSIYRGDHVWIYGDGYDVEDGDDQNFNNAKFEWRIQGRLPWEDTTYWSPATPTKGGGDWYQNLQPPALIDTPVDVYQFRVSFEDTDGEWGQPVYLEEINVLNNPPWLDSFSTQMSSVYRGNTVRVYAYVDDVEEAPNALDVTFYYQHATSGTGWLQTWWAINGVWDGTSFYADFNPPYSAELGPYKFMVEITDQKEDGIPGDTVTVFPTEFIDVSNNLPFIIDIKTSIDSVRAGVNERVYIHVNASDGFENTEQELNVADIQWRESGSGGGYGTSPSEAFTLTNNEGYESSGGGYIKASMEPEESASKVMYDIRIRVEDQDSGVSDWMELTDAFTVTNPSPTLIDHSLGATEVFRGDTVYIFVNASDPSPDLDESELTVEVAYRIKGSNDLWTEINTGLNDYYGTAPNGFWTIPFSPDTDWDDSDLDDYEFQVIVFNGVSFSNQGNPVLVANSIEVKNNVPEAISMGAEGLVVQRSSFVIIYAVGEDKETDKRSLTPIFEYSTDGGTKWEKSYLGTPNYNAQQSRWEVEFEPGSGADLASYDFQVKFFDELDYGDPIGEQGLVEVTNAAPVVTSLTISDDTALRMEELTLTAVVADADQDVGTLIPNFQFQGPEDSNWKTQSSSNYFGNPSFENGKWVITFTAPADADVGDYNFRVEFTDTADVTSEANAVSEIIGALTLENSEPEVDITSPSAGSRSPGNIKFEATGYDQEGSDQLTWLWDFGDGETSDLESPSHEYTELGDYTITVTVTDPDGSSVEAEITITIKGEPEGDSMTFILLILVLVIVVVLVVVLLLVKKKKKPEAAAPPAYDTAAQPAEVPQPPTTAPPVQPGAQPVPAPPAPVAPSVQPDAQPATTPVAPAAAPMAAPAAAPAQAGQMIKCPKCATPFPVTSTERPITIECPKCGAKGTLK